MHSRAWLAAAVFGTVLALAAAAAPLGAQVDPETYWRWRLGNPQGAPPPQQELPDRGGAAPEYRSPLLGVPDYRPGFQGLGRAYPYFAPRYPEGYGLEPKIGGFLPAQPPEPVLTPTPPMRLPIGPRRGWPSWIAAEIGEDERAATPARAVLIRHADRVWVLPAHEDAFVPLAYYDKIRLLESGAVVEARNRGEFQILFHDGATLRADGPARIALPRIAEDDLVLQVRELRRLWIATKTRPTRVLLPDGSALSLANAEIYLERVYDRVHLYTHGPGLVHWDARTGPGVIPPAREVELFLDGSSAPWLGASLELEGALHAERDGRVLVVRGGPAGGRVTWCGARIAVPAGAVLRIDPLAGEDFPEYRPQ